MKNNNKKIVNKPVETTNEQPKDGIYYNGKFLEMEYEELVDLFATFRDKGDFKFCNLTKEKANNVFGSLLPMTDY